MEATREAAKDSVVLNALAEGVPEREMGVVVGGVMPHFGGCFDHQTAASTPMAPLPEEQMRTHVADVRGNPLAVPEALVPTGQASSASPPEEDHRRGRPEFPADDGGDGGVVVVPGDAAAVASGTPPEEEVCGRERLKRHRVAMAGRVWIPESWGQEKLLTDWIDCAAIDRALVPSGLLLAREALVEECRRANSGRFRMENRCLST